MDTGLIRQRDRECQGELAITSAATPVTHCNRRLAPAEDGNRRQRVARI
jgi:hypothetical protein